MLADELERDGLPRELAPALVDLACGRSGAARFSARGRGARAEGALADALEDDVVLVVALLHRRLRRRLGAGPHHGRGARRPRQRCAGRVTLTPPPRPRTTAAALRGTVLPTSRQSSSLKIEIVLGTSSRSGLFLFVGRARPRGAVGVTSSNGSSQGESGVSFFLESRVPESQELRPRGVRDPRRRTPGACGGRAAHARGLAVSRSRSLTAAVGRSLGLAVHGSRGRAHGRVYL